MGRTTDYFEGWLHFYEFMQKLAPVSGAPADRLQALYDEILSVKLHMLPQRVPPELKARVAEVFGWLSDIPVADTEIGRLRATLNAMSDERAQQIIDALVQLEGDFAEFKDD